MWAHGVDVDEHELHERRADVLEQLAETRDGLDRLLDVAEDVVA